MALPFVPPARVAYSIIFFVLAMSLLFVMKPKAIFDKESDAPRAFGTDPERTLFTLGVWTVVLAVLSFYVFALIDMVYAGARSSYP